MPAISESGLPKEEGAIKPPLKPSQKEKRTGSICRVVAIIIGALASFLLIVGILFQLTRTYVIDKAEEEIESILLQHKGVHHYVQRKNHPELYRLIETGAAHHEAYTPVLFSSSYMVRNMHVFYNEERVKAGRQPLYYKMAATNPRNPVNVADPLEARLIDLFNRNPDQKEYREIQEIDGKKFLYVVIPFLRNNENCLKCHGRREDAPPQLQVLYPGPGGFNEKAGDLRAVESIRAPIEAAMAIPYIVLAAATVVGLGLLSLAGLSLHLRNTVASRTLTIAEQAEILRRNEESLRITLHSIGDGVISTDTEGRVVRMNSVAEIMTGWKESEADGKLSSEVFRIVQGESRQQCANPVEKVLAFGEKVELENHTVLISRDGKEYQIADSGAPIKDREGHIVGVVLVFRDVTERYVLEERLRQSQKLEAIGQLAGGVAHDFNNMLGGILGGAELLEMSLSDNPDDRKSLEIIINSAERAKDLTRKLLVFSRKGRLNLVPMDVHQSIRETIQLMERTIDKRIKIETQLEASETTIAGDLSQIQNALLNIGINAAHAMPEGGTIRFATRNTVIEELFVSTCAFTIKPGPYIDIEASDTGCGISPENLKRIFEPFFTTKGVGKGTGLGLAAVYGTVQQHNGSISVYSEVGKGTVFRLLFPICSDTPRSPTEIRTPVKGHGKILLVDDEPGIRDSGRAILSQLGYEVMTAENGKEAVDLYTLEHERLDLVLLDLAMPVMDGRTCLQKMHEIDPSIPVIICSGFARDDVLTELELLGVSSFLIKPFRVVELSQVIAQALIASRPPDH